MRELRCGRVACGLFATLGLHVAIACLVLGCTGASSSVRPHAILPAPIPALPMGKMIATIDQRNWESVTLTASAPLDGSSEVIVSGRSDSCAILIKVPARELSGGTFELTPGAIVMELGKDSWYVYGVDNLRPNAITIERRGSDSLAAGFYFVANDGTRAITIAGGGFCLALHDSTGTP